MSAPDFTAIFNQVHGFLSLPEAETLYRLASEVPAGGTIVEIGSYQGRSTVCLGLGAKVNGARVFAIDPHEDCQVNDETHYGMENHAALLKNLVAFDLADTVRVVAISASLVLMLGIGYPLNLVFIDGSHVYEDVIADFRHVSKLAVMVALHDASGHFPGVTQALEEILAAGQWKIAEQVDALVVLGRVS